jgi:hypothetical protein
MGIRDLFDPGFGMEKFRSGIRDKHPGSATPVLSLGLTGSATILYVIYTDEAGMWRVQCVAERPNSFANRSIQLSYGSGMFYSESDILNLNMKTKRVRELDTKYKVQLLSSAVFLRAVKSEKFYLFY